MEYTCRIPPRVVQYTPPNFWLYLLNLTTVLKPSKLLSCPVSMKNYEPWRGGATFPHTVCKASGTRQSFTHANQVTLAARSQSKYGLQAGVATLRCPRTWLAHSTATGVALCEHCGACGTFKPVNVGDRYIEVLTHALHTSLDCTLTSIRLLRWNALIQRHTGAQLGDG